LEVHLNREGVTPLSLGCFSIKSWRYI